jgi:hypothetical protein
VEESFNVEFEGMHELHQWHYKVIDVLGDGNCGFYALNMGLVNIGKAPETTLHVNNFMREMVSMRKRIAATLCNEYLQKQFENEDWLVFLLPTFEREEFENQAKLNYPSLLLNFYKKDLVPDKNHFMMDWSAYAATLAYKICLVIVIRTVFESQASWQTVVIDASRSTTTQHDLVFTSYPGVYRLPEDYAAGNRVEILLQSGADDEDVVKHFSFLYRLPLPPHWTPPENPEPIVGPRHAWPELRQASTPLLQGNVKVTHLPEAPPVTQGLQHTKETTSALPPSNSLDETNRSTQKSLETDHQPKLPDISMQRDSGTPATNQSTANPLTATHNPRTSHQDSKPKNQAKPSLLATTETQQDPDENLTANKRAQGTTETPQGPTIAESFTTDTPTGTQHPETTQTDPNPTPTEENRTQGQTRTTQEPTIEE